MKDDIRNNGRKAVRNDQRRESHQQVAAQRAVQVPTIWRVFLVLACSICSLFSFPIQAQSTSGTALGTITDNSHAAVPGARVELINTDTGDKRSDMTSATGSYQFINVTPGNYKLEVQSAGFKHFTQINIVVQIGSSTRTDASLQVGEVSQSVEVTSQAALLETQQATIGQVIEGRSVTEMPLNGRDVQNLIALAPGVVPLQDFQSNSAAKGMMGTFNGGDYVLSGGIPNGGVEFVDGGSINTGYENALSFVPSQDAIQEFKIESNNISPEYGGTENGVVAMVTKSGTNRFHGSVFEYLRNTVLNANTFFGNQAGLPRPAFIQNQYGATVGGPLKKDKIFFFTSWEAARTAVATTTSYTVPTLAQRAALTTGDLSSITTPITDPGSFNSTYTVFTPAPAGTKFANNQIPLNRIDPTSKAMLAYWAPPNPLLTGKTNYIANLLAHPRIDQYLGRVDWNISDKQRIFARYLYQDFNNAQPMPYGNIPYLKNNYGHVTQWVGGDDYTFNATTILNVRGAYLHYYNIAIMACAPCDISFLGWPAATIAQMTPRTITVPTVTATGYSNNAGQGVLAPITEGDDAISGSITKILGRHTLKFGGEFRREPNSYGQVSGVETFAYTNAFTGNAWASYVLGLPFKTTEQTAYFPQSVAYYAGTYINDNFQLNSRLSLNVGLRWEYPGYWKEQNDRQTVFLPNVMNPLALAANLPLKGDVALVNTAAYPSRLNLLPHHDLFSPRLGLAYRLTNKNVIRSGYGISYAPTALLEQLAQPNNSPINAATTLIQTAGTPINAFHNPYPNGILQPVGRVSNYEAAAIFGQSINVSIPNEPSAYIAQWNVDFEHDFGHQIVFDVAYVGAKGEHLAASNNPGIDQLADSYQICGTDKTQPQCGGHLLLDQVPNPFYGLVPSSSSMGGVTVAAGQLLRPYPQYYNLTNPATAAFYSMYEGLQVKVQKRLGSGGNLLLSYTYANDNGNADTTTAISSPQVPASQLQDFTNPKSDVSQLSFNIPQLFVASYVVDLPFGKGKRFLANESGFLDRLVSGFGIDGITSYHSGYPLAITEQATPLSSNFGAGTPRPNVAAGCQTVNSTGSAASRINQWFNTACFTQTTYSFGNELRTDPNIRGQGFANWDLSLVKATLITEGVSLQFRAEMFNIFNRVQFAQPNAVCCTATNASFGAVTSQINNPRQVQFALKATF